MTNNNQKQSFLYRNRKFIGILLCAMLLALFLFRFFLYLGIVTSTSMEPTLLPGSVLIGVRHKEPSRGDVGIFYDNGFYLVKRVIGQPGDTVEFTESSVIVNGEILNEPYVKNPAVNTPLMVQIPENKYLVLGDNRANSYDFRETRTFIERNQFVATLKLIIQPGGWKK
ncbi:signal peptidase I [Eubacterium limosum]|uniref:signal peptidase I n=1 Tax=Eubacterium limosum TaxID=1736 RepID=UPI00371FDE5E